MASHHHPGGQSRVVLQLPVETVELYGGDRVGTATADLRQEVGTEVVRLLVSPSATL